MEEISTKVHNLQRDENRLNKSKKYPEKKEAQKHSFERKYGDSKKIRQTVSKQDKTKMEIKRKEMEKVLNQNTLNEQKEMSKNEKNALNFKKQEEIKRKCNVDDIDKKSYHSTKCCRRRWTCRQKLVERRPFPCKNQATKMLRHHISRAAAMYSEFFKQFPNLKVILLFCQDILLLKMLNRIRGTQNYSNIRKNIERSYHKMNRAARKQQKTEVKTVESIAENSLKRLFEDENQQENNTARKRFKMQHYLPEVSAASVSERTPLLHQVTHCSENLEQGSVVSERNDDSQQISKHTCKCYRNHVRAEIPSKRVKRMLENYESMITTCDIQGAKNNKDGMISDKRQQNEEEKAVSFCFNDAYECECKSEDSKLLKTYKLNEVIKKNCKDDGGFGVTLQTTSQCTVYKGQCNSKNYGSTTVVNHILDQMVSEALLNIKKCYQRDMDISDSNDEQNHADDEQSSDSESECKRISAHTTAICRKTAKTENMNYVLLFGKSKSQLKKKDLSGQQIKEQPILSKKNLTSKQESGKTHVERDIQHYRMLQ